MRWRRDVERALAPVGLTFTQWLVLEATADLVREIDDAVSQAEVARRTEIDKMTTSQVMKTLESKGLVDRGPDLTGRAYRIWVTTRGSQLARRARRALNQ
jgi:DNA-binding MarR family transcriptional regulator